MSDKAQHIDKWYLFMMNDRDIFLVRPPLRKRSKDWKYQTIDFNECSKFMFWWTPFYLMNIISFAKILRSLLSNKMEFCIYEKFNNSIATKLCANLPDNGKKWFNFSAQHNSMTNLCCALFKCENKLKIG